MPRPVSPCGSARTCVYLSRFCCLLVHERRVSFGTADILALIAEPFVHQSSDLSNYLLHATCTHAMHHTRQSDQQTDDMLMTVDITYVSHTHLERSYNIHTHSVSQNRIPVTFPNNVNIYGPPVSITFHAENLQSRYSVQICTLRVLKKVNSVGLPAQVISVATQEADRRI